MSSLVHVGQIEEDRGPWGVRPLFSETSASLLISLPAYSNNTQRWDRFLLLHRPYRFKCKEVQTVCVREGGGEEEYAPFKCLHHTIIR